MTTYLDRILAAHRAAAAADDRDARPSSSIGRSTMPPTRGFRAALDAAARRATLAVIAEVKRARRRRATSPPISIRRRGPPPTRRGRDLPVGAHRRRVLRGLGRRPGRGPGGVALPVLRKDFTVDARDVCDARLMGADCVLLIAAALDDAELESMHALARRVGLDALVEVHDEAELDRAVAVGRHLVGVNQRDLVTFEVDTARAVRMAPQMPDGSRARRRVGHPRRRRRRRARRGRLPRRAGGGAPRHQRRSGAGRGRPARRPPLLAALLLGRPSGVPPSRPVPSDFDDRGSV